MGQTRLEPSGGPTPDHLKPAHETDHTYYVSYFFGPLHMDVWPMGKPETSGATSPGRAPGVCVLLVAPACGALLMRGQIGAVSRRSHSKGTRGTAARGNLKQHAQRANVMATATNWRRWKRQWHVGNGGMLIANRRHLTANCRRSMTIVLLTKTNCG